MTTRPSDDPCVWSEPIQIHSCDVDFHQQATTEALCRHCLEAAWNHAETLGAGYSHLAAQNRFWVLSRLLLRIEAPAIWGETLTLRTWPRPAKSLFAFRDFEMADKNGGCRLGGTSAWLVLDRQSRRPQRLDKLLSRLGVLADVMALGRDPEKLPGLTAGAPARAIDARYSDIDVHRHVNTTRYIGWLLDSYPLDFHETHRLEQLEVNYLGETRGGDQLSVSTEPVSPSEFLHGMVKPNGEEVCRARTRWVPRV